MKNKALYIVIAVIVVLGVGVAGASAYTGRAVTTRLSQQTAQLDKLLPELQVEETISRGLFNSTRDVKFQLGCVPVPAADGKSIDKTAPIEVHWRDTIRHVPFFSGQGSGVARIDSELFVPAAGVEQLFGTHTPLTIRTHIDFDSRFDSNAKVAPFKLAPKPGDELEFSGLTLRMQGKLPDGAGKFSYTGNTEPLRMSAKASDGNFTATVGKMDLTGTMVLDAAAATFVLPYENETRISDMTFQFETPARDGDPSSSYSFAVQRVTGTVESKIANDLWTNSSRVSGSLKLENFAIDKFEFGSALRNVHAPTLNKLLESWMSRSFSCAQTQLSDNPMAELEALGADAFALLPHSPEYQVGPIAIELGGKRAELSYTVGVHGIAAGSSPPPLMQLMLKHAYARAEAKLHLGLIDQLAAWGQQLAATGAGAAKPSAPAGAPDAGALMARAMIDGFVQQGFLEREGESVRGRIEVDAGAIKLNDRPFQLPDLPGLGAVDMDAVKSLMQAGGSAGDADEAEDP
jgi:uncharacterized protein YdgA (DUF945 family)